MTLPYDSPERLAAWIAKKVDSSVTAVQLTRLAGGHSGGAWRVDLDTDAGRSTPLVLKAPDEPSVVYRRNPSREARIIGALARTGAAVPALVAIESDPVTLGRPYFLMEHISGRSVADASPAGYHDDAQLHDLGADGQRAVWNSFHDALAALHTVDPAKVPDASLGLNGVADVLSFWRDALLDAAPATAVPRQLAVLDWLLANIPPDADESPAVCMGDARLVNCLIAGAEVQALVDFEVAYVGNPASDIGYSVFLDSQQRLNTKDPLPGIPTADQTWERWGLRSGRSTDQRDYWTTFGVMIIAITATRAMIQWGFAEASAVESVNPLVAAWEATVGRSAGA